LSEIVEAKGGHGWFSVDFTKKPLAGVPDRRRRLWRRLSGPPERLVDFVIDVGPGPADIVKVAFAPMRKLLTAPVALPPNLEGLTQLGQDSPNMMICHRFVCQSRHL